MRQHLAKREAGLVFVQLAMEDLRHQLRHRQRPCDAGVGDQAAALGVMLDQLADPDRLLGRATPVTTR